MEWNGMEWTPIAGQSYFHNSWFLFFISVSFRLPKHLENKLSDTLKNIAIKVIIFVNFLGNIIIKMVKLVYFLTIINLSLLIKRTLSLFVNHIYLFINQGRSTT